MQQSDSASLPFGLLALAAGGLLVGIGFGIVPVDPETVHAPPWVLVACGLVFALGGVAILPHKRPWLSSASGVTIILAMGLVAAWVSLSGDAAQMSGGLPFVSREVNVALGRGVFGLSALMCFALFAWGAAGIARGHTD